MMTKTQSNGRPSSPRKFFARLYGHLETTKGDRERSKTGQNPDASPRLSSHEETTVSECSVDLDKSSRRVSPETVSRRRLPYSGDTREPEETDPGDACKEDEGRRSERSVLNPLPFLQGPALFPAAGPHLQLSHLSHLSYFPHIGATPSLPRAALPPLTEAHFHGFSAFRKSLSFDFHHFILLSICSSFFFLHLSFH